VVEAVRREAIESERRNLAMAGSVARILG
jgi:hypothetical protein